MRQILLFAALLALLLAGCAAGGVTSGGGALGCGIKLHDMTGRQPAVSLSWPDEILLKAQWCGDKLLAVTDRGARVISTDGTVLYEARFAETPTAMATQ